eukprot:scaffold13473_cov55-Phaeocystis_antarctica.AAC.1
MACAWRVHLSRLAQPRTNRHAHLVRARAKVRVRVGESVEVRASVRVRASCFLCCKRASASTTYKALVQARTRPASASMTSSSSPSSSSIARSCAGREGLTSRQAARLRHECRALLVRGDCLEHEHRVARQHGAQHAAAARRLRRIEEDLAPPRA